MDKKFIIKYFIGYTIIAFIVNYLIREKKITPLNNSAIIRIENKKLISNKPIAFDLNVIEDEIVKNITFQKEFNINEYENKIITLNNNIYFFSSYSGSPIKHVFIHPITKKELVLFDYTEKINQSYIPPISLCINDQYITDFTVDISESEENKIVFSKNYDSCLIKKIFTIKNNYIDCNIEISNPNNIDLGVVKIIGQQQNAIEKDCNQNAFCYTDEEKISKFFPINKLVIDQSVIIYPEIIGFQSDYSAQAIISKNSFIKGYFNLSSTNQIQYFLENKASKDATSNIEFTWYSGPKEYSIMNSINEKLSLIMEYGWFSKISLLPMSFILWLTGLLNSFGLALLFFIALTKLILIPFGSKIKETNKKSKELQQKLEYVKTKYHNDKDKCAAEEIELYKKYGIMPGFFSHIPKIFNFLIVMSLQVVFKKNILLYQVPVGLWIKDATIADQYYILPFIFLFMMYLTINQMKIPPMAKIAVLIVMILFVYIFSFWASGIQLFIVGGIIANYIENKFLLN